MSCLLTALPLLDPSKTFGYMKPIYTDSLTSAVCFHSTKRGDRSCYCRVIVDSDETELYASEVMLASLWEDTASEYFGDKAKFLSHFKFSAFEF